MACNLVIGMAWHGLASIELDVKIAFRGDTLSFLALFTCQHLEGTIPIDIGLASIGRRVGKKGRRMHRRAALGMLCQIVLR